ncbi:MAG: magnesium-translocating P-type ATPase, partial [Verrucomicrobiia bacterium]
MASLKNPNTRPGPDVLQEAAVQEATATLQRLNTSLSGLSEEEAAARLEQYGPNEVAQEKQHGWLRRLWIASRNPLVILLMILAIFTFATAGDASDYVGGFVMVAMVLLALSLRLIQETKADNAAAKLKAMIKVTATVIRDGGPKEIPLKELVPGDIVKLSAGDMIPGDVRLIAAKDLFIIQATLTGESLPVEKTDARDPRTNVSIIEHTNICFLGTSVESGAATAAVVATGAQTYFGKMASSLAGQQVETAFDRGVKKFTWLMIGFMVVLSPLVFFINGLTKHSWGKDTFLCALAIAVGLTPEMLPMIVSVCLSKGALAMSKKKVIVKRLNSIQNFGAMNVLCTDKTGTLTEAKIKLLRVIDGSGVESANAFSYAYVNSKFETGVKSPLDEAILSARPFDMTGFKKIDEAPFDFERRRVSVLVEHGGKHGLFVKGAPEDVLRLSSQYQDADGVVKPLNAERRADIQATLDGLGAQGLRALGIASRLADSTAATANRDRAVITDETDMVFAGFAVFLDPPKASAGATIRDLEKAGVVVKVVTGDNELVSRHVFAEIGVAVTGVLSGETLDRISEEALIGKLPGTNLFCRINPQQKHRILLALKRRGDVVGFMGDGINDAPALHAADVGISVEGAADVARAAADLILLEPNLAVVGDAIAGGRAAVQNVTKYVLMGASSNFGNMFS